jgi:uroporphyrinogen-III decarboxylase
VFDWPGHGLGENAGWQFKEAEYMPAEEYDDFIRDPSDYWTRVHMPRIMGAAAPLARLLSPVSMVEQVHVVASMSPFGLPDVQDALKTFMKAGEEARAWQKKMSEVNRKQDELGFPSTGGGFCYAPFDFLGDTLRSTRGIAMDMYRRPEKLQEAIERSTPLMISWGCGVPLGSCPIVGIPLHKGADGFMSAEQFDRFYWPSLLEVIKGLNREGLIPRLFAEGGYNDRLERIGKDLGECRSVWHFDYTDMARAKEIIGDKACLMGNVHASMLQANSTEEITAYCKELIETAGRDGGYIFSTGIGIGRTAKVENVRAMLDAVTEYGLYK